MSSNMGDLFAQIQLRHAKIAGFSHVDEPEGKLDVVGRRLAGGFSGVIQQAGNG